MRKSSNESETVIEMNYKGIVFFDYDGTLTDENESIFSPTEETGKAIDKLNENGYLTVLATGRAKCYVPETGLNFGGLVTSNGAYAEVDGKEIFQSYMPENDVAMLMKAFDEEDICYSLENQKRGYVKGYNEPLFQNMLEHFKLPKASFTELDRNNIPRISKINTVYLNIEQHYRLQKKFDGRYKFDLHRAYLSSDVQAVGINKSVGAKAVAQYLGIDTENIYVFGDGPNDYEIFCFAGHAIAMENHNAALDNVCEYITSSVKNEGIKNGLEHYCLI